MKRWPKEQEDFLIEAYSKVPMEIIINKLNKSYQNIRSKACMLKLKRDRSLQNKKYTIDQDYFENVDCEEKAYWLGFLMADGCIRFCENIRKANLILDLAAKDKHHLDRFAKCIGSNVPITYRKSKNTYMLRCCNYKICCDLNNLGCTPRKTFTLQFPKLEESLVRHFVRGYFDGDGCISKYANSNCFVCFFLGNEKFLKCLSESLNYIGLFKDPKIISKQKIFQLSFSQKQQVDSLYHYMYDDANIYLERKYIKFPENLKCL